MVNGSGFYVCTCSAQALHAAVDRPTELIDQDDRPTELIDQDARADFVVPAPLVPKNEGNRRAVKTSHHEGDDDVNVIRQHVEAGPFTTNSGTNAEELRSQHVAATAAVGAGAPPLRSLEPKRQRRLEPKWLRVAQ